MIKQLYKWFLKITSSAGETQEYSAGYWAAKVRRAALELCREKNGRLLDVGCGEGLFLAKLGLSNPDIVIWGIDNNFERLNETEKRLEENGLKNTKLIYGDAFNLPFDDFSFDTVVCINVLYNMPSKSAVRKSLKDMGRICKSGGHIIFDFRNALNPLLNVKYKLAHLYDPSTKNLPLRTDRIDEVESLLNEMDFEVTRRPYVCFPRGKFMPVILLEAKKLR